MRPHGRLSRSLAIGFVASLLAVGGGLSAQPRVFVDFSLLFFPEQTVGGSSATGVGFPIASAGERTHVRLYGSAELENSEVWLMECDAPRNPPTPSCYEPGSDLYFELDDPAICDGGACLAPEIAADDSGTSGRVALRHQSQFPPENTQILTVEPGGSVEVVAGEGDPMPDGGGATFTALQHVAVSGDYVAYSGFGTSGRSGLYLFDSAQGTHSRVVDNTMARPRAAGNHDAPGAIAMRATASGHELAWTDGGGAYVVAISASAGLSGSIEQPIATGDLYAPGRTIRAPFRDVAFWQETDRVLVTAFGQFFTFGVYSAARAAPGTVVRHADGETPVPGGSGGFSTAQRGSAAGDTLVFEGFDSLGAYLGVFLDADLADGEVQQLLLRDDVVALPAGGTGVVDTAAIDPGSALDPGRFSLYFALDDGRTGVAHVALARLIADFEEGDFSEWSSVSP